MRNFYIKQNGYTIGRAVGKSAAVEYLEKLFRIEDENGEWITRADGSIEIKVRKELYSIEES